MLNEDQVRELRSTDVVNMYPDTIDQCCGCDNESLMLHTLAKDELYKDHLESDERHDECTAHNTATADIDAIHKINKRVGLLCKNLGKGCHHELFAETALLTRFMAGMERDRAVTETLMEVNDIHYRNCE